MNMKPIIIIPPNTMSQKDIACLRANNICVVVSKNPEHVKFLDPIPSTSSRTEMEGACVRLSRKVFAGQVFNEEGVRHYGNAYIKCLIEGTVLDPRPNPQEREKQIYDSAKDEEIRKLAREDAKKERDARKAALVANQQQISK